MLRLNDNDNYDLRLVLAEMRAGDLLTALQSALNGDPHWRANAAQLLEDIRNLIIPAAIVPKFLEIDAKKRAAEILEDHCRG